MKNIILISLILIIFGNISCGKKSYYENRYNTEVKELIENVFFDPNDQSPILSVIGRPDGKLLVLRLFVQNTDFIGNWLQGLLQEAQRQGALIIDSSFSNSCVKYITFDKCGNIGKDEKGNFISFINPKGLFIKQTTNFHYDTNTGQLASSSTKIPSVSGQVKNDDKCAFIWLVQ